MARAFVGAYKINEMLSGPVADSSVVPMDVAFVGPDVRGGQGPDIDEIRPVLNNSDTLNAMGVKIVDAVVARAAAIGYTVARNAVTLIPYQKGS